MSNSIYNILNNFNKVAQEPAKSATQTNKPKTKLQESVEGVLSEKYMGFKKVAAAAKASGAENPEAVAASIGRKKYGKEKFQKAAAAGKKLGEGNNPFANVDSRVEKPTIPGTNNKAKSGYYPPSKPPVQKLAKPIDEADMDEGNEFSGALAKAKAQHKDSFEVDGKQYPVKENGLQRYTGIKKYGKDGFEALQKAGREGADEEEKGRIKDRYTKKSKNKVQETIQSLLAAGFTKEQIIEGWDDMMKSVEKSRRDEKGTGKFDNKKISTGTVYTRKYNPKTGEADDSENVTKEKRGRGRPKKNAFESRYTTVNKMITESFLSENGAAPIQPKDAEKFMKSSDPKIFDKLTGNKTQTPAGGTIKQGVWTADAPKAGQKPVPVPQNPEMAKEGTPDLNTTLGIKTTPTTKATPYKGPDLNTTLGIKSTPASAPASTSTVPDINKLTIDAMNKTNETAKEDEEMQEALNQMRRIAGLPVIESKADKKADEDYDNDGKIESGKDEYLGSKIRAARDAGKLGEGKMCKKCDCDPCECDKEKVDECSSPMGNGMMGQESNGKMNITTNMNSDGNKSVTITADGDAASDLMQMLKLAGMQGGDAQQQEPVGVMVVSNDEDEVEENLEIRANPAGASSAEQAKAIGAQSPQQGGKEPNYAYKIGEEEVEEAKDERYHASTTPDEQVSFVQAQTKGGNGDVAGQEKRMRKGGYQFGDNNLAMKDVYEGIDGLEAMGRKLYKEYQSIKVQK